MLPIKKDTPQMATANNEYISRNDKQTLELKQAMKQFAKTYYSPENYPTFSAGRTLRPSHHNQRNSDVLVFGNLLECGAQATTETDHLSRNGFS